MPSKSASMEMLYTFGFGWTWIQEIACSGTFVSDAINAGNCKFAFSEALKRMYGIQNDLNSLLPMPEDGGTWSVMQSWALPTKSFQEFVMFSRMFVDALDAQIARRMLYVNSETGVMQEYHKLKGRRGKMWVKWFSINTLKAMDEDLAEESDSDHSKRRRLWPSTGEVVWQGVLEREKSTQPTKREKEAKK
ncbi:hypothetical protein CRYUN_Cryun20dG0031600 [Craigia yunnanensis]